MDWSLIRVPRSTSFGHTNIAIAGRFVRSAETCRASRAELLRRRMVAAYQSLLNERCWGVRAACLGRHRSGWVVRFLARLHQVKSKCESAEIRERLRRRSSEIRLASLRMEQALPARSHVPRVECFRFAGKVSVFSRCSLGGSPTLGCAKQIHHWSRVQFRYRSTYTVVPVLP